MENAWFDGRYPRYPYEGKRCGDRRVTSIDFSESSVESEKDQSNKQIVNRIEGIEQGKPNETIGVKKRKPVSLGIWESLWARSG
jgi:hypothetical protein